MTAIPRQRNFSYVSNRKKDSVDGNDKQKGLQITETQNIAKRNLNDICVGLDKENRVELATKIVENYQDFKSCLPFDLQQLERKRLTKTQCQQRRINMSGVAYLMVRSSDEGFHSQKRHLAEQKISQNRSNEIGRKGKKHYWKPSQSDSQIWDTQPRKMSEATSKKLQNDLYSKIELKENIINHTVKMSKKTMFTQGIKLGFNAQKQSKMSHAKRKEIMGSNYIENLLRNKKIGRSDWNKSSITLC